MNESWPEFPLSDFIHIKHGFAFKGEYFESEETPDCLLTPGNFAIGGGFKADKLKYYSGPVGSEYVLCKEDLVVTMTDLSKQADTLGYPALVPDIEGKRLLHNQRIGLVEFKQSDTLDKFFLYFLLRSKDYRHHVVSTATGSTVKHTSPSKILSFRFKLPPLVVQQEVGRKLLLYELKVELNRQINQTLEKIAQTIFKSWFVDFDPVKAKVEAKAVGRDPERAAMCAISGKSETELDQILPEQRQQLATTAALFPDELVESELGLIPKRWDPQRLDRTLELAYGKSLPKTKRKAGDVPVYGSGGNTGCHSVSLVDGPGVIVGRKGTVGALYWEDRPFFPIDTVFYVVPKNGIPLHFLYYHLQTLGLATMNTDAAVPGLNRGNVYRLPVPKFPTELIAAFSEKVIGIRRKLSTNFLEIETLGEIRDVLLPRLLSGKLEITQTD